MASHANFKEGEIYQVKQGEKTYDAVFLKTYKNDKHSFIFGDNLLDSDYPLTVDGKPMLIASARECVNPKWMKLWNTTTNKTASLHERIVFKFPEVTKPMANEMSTHRGFESGKIYLIRQGRHKYNGLCTKSANGKHSFVVGKNLLDSDKPINVNGVLMKMIGCNDEVAQNKIKELQTLTNKIEPIPGYQKFIFKEIE